MKICQVLHKNIPSKDKVFTLFHQQQTDVSQTILKMIKKVKKETRDTRMINIFCIELHDLLYHAIISRKIKIAKKILRLLELLALPMKHIGEQKRNQLLKKICKIKM